MKVVVDTNVLVSGILNPRGYPGQIVQLIFDGDLTLLVNDAVMAEYREVLLIRDLPVSSSDAQLLLSAMQETAEFVSQKPSRHRASDPDDQDFVDISEASGNAVIITGNLKHFQGIRQAVSPRSFIEDFYLKSN